MSSMFVLQEVPRDTQQIERIHDSVLDAIHAALSKESLVKKLVLPFNETLAAATKVFAFLYNALLFENQNAKA